MVLHGWILHITDRNMHLICGDYCFLSGYWCGYVCICLFRCTQSVFSEAKAEVVRNSLPLCPCVGGGREEDGGGLVVVESH